MQRPYCFYILLTDSFEFRLAQEKRITGFHSFMEQEVKVTMHSHEPAEKAEEQQNQENISEQLRELGDVITETFACFRESDSYEWILENTEKTRQYIKKNPARSMLVSLGAGFLFGLFMKRGR